MFYSLDYFVIVVGTYFRIGQTTHVDQPQTVQQSGPWSR